MMEQAEKTVSISLPAASVLPILIIFFTLLNGFCNSLASAFGRGFPYDSFVFHAGDLLGDFIKASLSYPGPEIQGVESWPDLYRDYLANNPYGGVSALAKGELSNLHGMPVPTLVLLEARRAMAFYDPNLVTFTFFTPVIASFCAVIWTQCRKSSARAITVLAYLLCYPLIFAVTRGNITAIMLGNALAVAVLLTIRGRHLWLVLILLAFAVNLRPNAAIFLVLPFLQWSLRRSLAAVAVTLAMAAVFFLAALTVATHFYPDYTLGNFYQALLVYEKFYALGNHGLAYGSSLLGGAKFVSYFLLGTSPTRALELATSLLGVGAIGLWLFVFLRRQLDPLVGLFILTAIYALFSGVFGDYHLIVFFAFVVIYVQEGRSPFTGNRSDLLIGLAVLIVLIPKNYIFFEGISAQVVLNPLVLLIAALGVYVTAWCSPRGLSSVGIKQ